MALKERYGTVVSDKMDKTVIVSIENKITHKKYLQINYFCKFLYIRTIYINRKLLNLSNNKEVQS